MRRYNFRGSWPRAAIPIGVMPKCPACTEWKVSLPSSPLYALGRAAPVAFAHGSRETLPQDFESRMPNGDSLHVKAITDAFPRTAEVSAVVITEYRLEYQCHPLKQS